MRVHEPWPETENLARVERRLQEMYERSTPDPRFLARLERDLEARRRRGGRFPLLRVLRRRWTWAAAVALLAFLIGVAWLGGPREAWAQFLRLIGYAPHVGFVDIEGARILPVEVTQQIGDVTIHVEQVVATREETRVVVTLQGSPVEGRSLTSLVLPYSSVTLRTSHGLELHPRQGTLKVENGDIALSLTFPPLPANIYQADLDLTALAQALHLPPTEEWKISFLIYPANSDLMAGVVIQPYEPVDAEETLHHITVRVAHVVHTSEQTAVQLKVTYPPHYHALTISPWPFPYLYDDVGHVYMHSPSSGAALVYNYQKGLPPGFIPVPTPSTVSNHTATWEEEFAPLSGLARRLTFVIPAIEGTAVINKVFALDFKKNLKPGESWPLDVRFNVDGIPVHITQVTALHNKLKDKYTFVFTVDAPEVDGKRLRGLDLYTVGGGGSVLVNGSAPLRHIAIDIPTAMLPRDHLHVRVVSAHITIEGPWHFEWDIPRPALPPSVRPVVLHPRAHISDQGITLWVDTLTLTDRVTVFDLKAKTPKGTTFDGISVRLVDERTGQEWEPQQQVLWCRPGTLRQGVQPQPASPLSACDRVFPKRIIFGPLSPATKAVTLKVDSVTLLHQEPITLTVPLPERLVFDTEVKGSAAARLDVDVRVPAGPFTIHFTEGWVREATPMEVWLLSEPLSREMLEGRFLHMPLLEVRADDRVLPLGQDRATTLVWDKENCATTPNVCQDEPMRVLLSVPLAGISPDALPTRLDITLAGVRWQVPGKWNLRMRPERLLWETKASKAQ